MRDGDRRSREEAAKTGGAITREKARAVGLSGKPLARAVRDEEWLTPTKRVLVLAGVPESFERDAWVALLDTGEDAGLTHDTALALSKVPGFKLRPIHVTTAATGRRPKIAGVVVHRSRLWLPHHRMLLNDSLPIATPTRALFDAANAGDSHELALERGMNNAWARRLTSGELLAKMADEWCERGRHGSAFLRAYLERHPIDWQPPESNLEARFCQIIADAGMPRPIRQKNVGDDVSWIGRVDVKDPVLPLIGEIDSDLFHTAPLDAESDEARDDRLEAAGFRVERFKEHAVWYEKRVVVDRWRNARREMLAARRDPA